jgi:predicted dehydrogenase
MVTRRSFNQLALSSSLGFLFLPSFLHSQLKLKPIRVGQIGTGHSHAEEKYQTLKKLTQWYDVQGIAEPDPGLKRSAEDKSEFNGANWLSMDQLLQLPGLQAILVETDFPDLLPTARRAIAAGMHIHIDKPPGNSLSGFKQIISMARERKLTVQMGYMFRYHPAFKFCISAVKSGLIGEVFEVQGVISKKIKKVRRDKLAATYGGGMMLLGCHLVDILVAICGKPIKISSYRKKTYPEKDNLFDNELAVFEYPRCVATIKSSLLEVGGPERRQFVVCGEKGSIEIKPLEPAVITLSLEKAAGEYKQGRQTIKLPDVTGRYDAQLIDFAQMVYGQPGTGLSNAHDIMVHEALLKACELI